jgi:outer membrane protein
MADQLPADRFGRGVSQSRFALMAASSLALLLFSAVAPRAETLEGALAKAYLNNPQLNAQRAGVRVADENIPLARSGGLPSVQLQLESGFSRQENGRVSFFGGAGRDVEFSYPASATLSARQSLFDGYRTRNRVRAADSQVLASREELRNTEQNVLLDGVVAYLNVLRDTAILNLRRNNIDVIREQLRQTQDRFRVGEVTRTDVAQAESRLAFAQAQFASSEAQLKGSLATYVQVIGNEPKKLASAKAVEKMLPRNRALALKIARAEHPAIIGALHGVDVQSLSVRIAEADLYPQLDLLASATYQRNNIDNSRNYQGNLSIVGRLTIPIFTGGGDYAQIRQEKERLGQQRLQADIQRDAVRQAVAASWGQLEASRSQIKAAQAQVDAAESALSGVREEAKVGQRTTLDVLNAQQEVLDARVNLIISQRDRVVASYNLLASVGRLNARVLRLKVPRYDASVHYDQVKDKLFGVRTPAGE